MMFYIGSDRKLPEIKYDKSAPALNVRTLSEPEQPAREKFSFPFVKYIGASGGCGCNFRHALLDHGTWLPVVGHNEADEIEIQKDQQSLYDFLVRELANSDFQIFCCWDGDQKEPELFREEIKPAEIAGSDFFFKERVFYSVSAGNSTQPD